MRTHFAQTHRCMCVCAHSVEHVCTCMCVCANHHVCMKTPICPCTCLWPCVQMCTFSHTNMHSCVLCGHTNTHEHVQTHMNMCACMCAQSICLAEQGHQHISAEQGLRLLPGVFPRKGVAPFHRGSWKGDLPVSLPLLTLQDEGFVWSLTKNQLGRMLAAVECKPVHSMVQQFSSSKPFCVSAKTVMQAPSSNSWVNIPGLES